MAEQRFVVGRLNAALGATVDCAQIVRLPVQFQAISAAQPKAANRAHFAFVLFVLFLWHIRRVLRQNVLVQVARLLESLAADVAHNFGVLRVAVMDQLLVFVEAAFFFESGRARQLKCMQLMECFGI